MASRTDTRPRTRLGREERREQLIAAATEVFNGRDPNDVTFEEVAEAAGVSRALVYNYFGDRHGLIEAVHLRHINDLRARVNYALASVRDRRLAMRRVVRVHLEYARLDPVGYTYAVGAPDAPQHPRLDAQRVDDVAAAWGGGVEAELLARGLLAAVRSMTLHWLELDSPDIDRAEDVISQFVWKGAAGASELGLELRPWWPVPPTVTT